MTLVVKLKFLNKCKAVRVIKIYLKILNQID